MLNKDRFPKIFINKITKETKDQTLVAAIDALSPKYSPGLGEEELSALQEDVDIDVAFASHEIIKGFILFNANMS